MFGNELNICHDGVKDMEGDLYAVNERERKMRILFLSYNLKKSIYQLVKLKGRSQK